MESISLIVPFGPAGSLADDDLDSYRRVLDKHHGGTPVEVILAGELDGRHSLDQADSRVLVPTARKGSVGALRAGIEAASGELLVVLDPRRSYPPEALVQLVEAFRRSDTELAIAVPQPQGGRSLGTSLARKCLGLAGQLSLGTSDAFSGLMAIRRSHLSTSPTAHRARGSRLVLDLLSWPCKTHMDVPVPTRPDDRPAVGLPRLDDVRQLKRLLDYRFGTFSRLVQFCIVGASGMIVDLTVYALLQWLFGQFWPVSASRSAPHFSWSLATAGALAILTALTWNFTLNRRLTFNDARAGSIPRQFFTYALGNALGIAVSLTLRLYLPMQVDFFNRHRLAAAVVGIIIATGISFSMSRWVVFIRGPEERAETERAPLPVG